MIIDQKLIKEITDGVMKQIAQLPERTFEIEASGRHVHLSQEDLDTLFGKDYELAPVKELSQPNQYACRERVTLVGPKGELQNVVILGPVRDATQVEVSLTDTRVLGVKPYIRESGNIANTPGITLRNGNKEITIKEGVIVAKRHIHVSEDDAKLFNVKDGQIVKVRTLTKRPLIFEDVTIRVSPRYMTYMHIDYDEANACQLEIGDRGYIVV